MRILFVAGSVLFWLFANSCFASIEKVAKVSGFTGKKIGCLVKKDKEKYGSLFLKKVKN